MQSRWMTIYCAVTTPNVRLDRHILNIAETIVKKRSPMHDFEQQQQNPHRDNVYVHHMSSFTKTTLIMIMQ